MRILFSVLDWGLGHASRSIPLIDKLLSRGHEVFLASSGLAGELLKRTYPDLSYLSLPPYKVTYSKNFNQGLAVLLQSPKLMRSIGAEQGQIRHYHKRYQFDRVISDHRYGCSLDGVPSVFLSHQLVLIPPKEFGWMRKWIFGLHISLLKKFDELWIPDFEGEKSLSGILSQGFPIGKTHRFLGPLSRFANCHPSETGGEEVCRAIAVVSGPEPQREIFEKKVIEIFRGIKGMRWVIQGRPGQGQGHLGGGIGEVDAKDKLIVVDHLESDRLMALLLKANMVISRSGYTSIMDYAALGLNKVVLVPTPGQSEQEYLARELHSKKWALALKQGELSLEKIAAGLKGVEGFPTWAAGDLLDRVLDAWL